MLFIGQGVSAQENEGLILDNPVQYQTTYDPVTDTYILQQSLGDMVFGDPIILSQEEFMNLLLSQSTDDYFKEKSQALDSQYRDVKFGDKDGKKEDTGFVLPSLQVKNKVFQTIFGGDKIELIPKGYASLDLGVFLQKLDNPQILPQNRSSFSIDLQQRIQMSILGKVGENLQLEANYDTQAGFGFENRMNIGWRPNGKGGEDNIIQNIEFGNVSMPLSTSLITGAQSLFGAKGEFKFGNTHITTLFSQQQSESKNITVQGGGVMNTFKIYAKDYQENQHYFLGQYFRDKYDGALANYPVISSQINISRLEVWVIDRGNSNQENRRAMVAIRDLGDDTTIPDNGTIYDQVSNLSGIRDGNTAENAIVASGLADGTGQAYAAGEQFLVHENVRLLNSSEYTYYPSLGYISLNQPLNDNDLLGVSFQYTLTSQPGEAYTVGEFSDQQSELLITKLLKSNTSVNTSSPMWDLMMKNIYSLETIQLSSEDFRLNIFYQDPEIGSGALNYLQGTSVEDQSLLQVLNMDRLNINGEVQQNTTGYGDGLFDYVQGITIDQENGWVKFTTVEPFAETIADAIGDPNSELVLDGLYDELPITFSQDSSVNRYYMEGQYKSAGGDGIPLGAFNIPQGSVTVTANGQELVEGVDYIVDYQLGRVQIINQMLKDSGTPINVSLENNSTFNLQTKRLMGLNVEHKFSDKLTAGATYMNYQERLSGSTQRAQYNSEPVSNSIFGANVLYNSKSEWLTRMTDKIPLIDTESPSQINFKAEAAYLKPGVNKSTGNDAYIDDFEDSQSNISLLDVSSWRLAATPVANSENPNPDFETTIFDPTNLSLNYNRRMLSWYNIDPQFYNVGGSSPLSNTDMSNHASRRVLVNELYSERELTAGTATYLTTLDLTYYPNERGPYNLNPIWQTESLNNRWAGITRPLSVTNLVETNVEYVEFWMMDPYADGVGNSPNAKLMLQLGNVSEDILRDGNMLYENGINQDGNEVESSVWGNQPSDYPILYSFDTEGDARVQQDVGYDGMLDAEEALQPGYDQFSSAQNPITAEIDPAADNYVYYLNDSWDSTPGANYLPNRYRYFRGTEGNSPSGSLEASSATPTSEDANLDYNLDRIENYNQYTIPLNQASLNNNHPFIVDTKTADVQFQNGQSGEVNWYLFRIPLDEFDTDAGNGSEEILTAARYMRMIVKGFENTTTLRFASFDMVRSDWVKYSSNLYPENSSLGEGEVEVDDSNLSIGQIDIESNSTATPPYEVPPGIERDQYQTSAGLQQQNEASMVMQLTSLGADEARAVFKSTNLDLRRYKQIKMFSHVHAANNGADRSGELKLFIRFGSDLVNNYYEYEIPMEYSPFSATTAEALWPEANMLDINTDQFVEAKLEAYEANNLERFQFVVDEETEKYIYVTGRPSLGSVSSIMIGLRNGKNQPIENAVVWINELRLSEIEDEAGYAATANLNMTLGDFAQINASGSISSVGFGALDLGPVERQQEEIINYTVNTAVNLDKFLPKKWGMKIPFNYTISEQFIDPKYNPLDNDVVFDEDPRKEELKDIVRTYSKKQTLAFNNIRKERVNTKRKQRFYDVENLSLSMLYNSDYYRDIYMTYNIKKDLRASLNYNYNFKKKSIQPFKKWRMVNDTAQSARYLQWVKEFNVNYVPSRLSFKTDIVRTYTQQQYRDINSYLIEGATPVQFNPIYSSNFLFNWQYNVGYDLTKSLRIDYTSSTRTMADITTDFVDDQLIFKNLFDVGRPINYNHQIQVNWKTPFRLFPYFEWTDVELGYTASYDWQARLTNTIEVNGVEENIGNLGQNAQTWTAVGNFDFNKLYDNFDVFKRLDSVRQGRKRELDSINRSFSQLAKKKKGLKKIRKAKVKLKNKFKIKDYFLMAIQSVKRGQFNYNRTSGIILPGLLAEPNFFGGASSGAGPNTSFLFGSQRDIRRLAVENGWVTNSSYLTESYTATRTSTFTANLQVQPSPSLRVDFTARRNATKNFYQSGYNTYDGTTYGYLSAFPNYQENFVVSTMSLGTSFKATDALYLKLIENVKLLSQAQGLRYGLTDTDGDGYTQGYGITNASILVPAFLATYQGEAADGNKLGYKKRIPLPNWNITYSGLTNMPFFAKKFDRLELSHSYQSSYTVSGVQSNLSLYADPIEYNADGTITTDSTGEPTSGLDGNGNLLTDYSYSSVSLVESFAPLVGVDMTFRNSMQISARYNKDRMISMSLSNYTLTEDVGNELVIGLGYTLKDVKMKMRYMGKKKTIKGDVNLRADLSIRDSETKIRNILENDTQVTGGQRIFSLGVTAQYMLSKSLSASLYYEQMVTKYKVSTAFPLSTVRAGVNITFTFGN